MVDLVTFISLCSVSFKHFLKSYTRYMNQDNFQKLIRMSDVCTRVTCTLEVPFIQRNRIHLFLSSSLFLEKEIFSDQTFLIVNTEVLRYCHHRWKFTQVQRTLLEYTLYLFRLFSRFCWLIIYTFLLLSLEAHFAPLGFANLALTQRLTQRSKTGDPPNEFYVSRGVNHARNT